MTTKDYQTRRPLRIFLSYFRPHRGLFLLDISCAFFLLAGRSRMRLLLLRSSPPDGIARG